MRTASPATATPTASTPATGPSPVAGPDVTTYRAVHTAIRRAPHRLADAVAVTDHRDTRRTRAIGRYWTGYATEVVAHHTVEDRVFFPALRARVPAAVAMTDRTDAEHGELDELLQRCERAVERLAVPGMAQEATAALRALGAHMDSHLDFEDTEMIPLIAATFSTAEYDTLEEGARKIVGIGKQAAFAVPFIVDAMTDQERAQAMATAPRPMRVLYRLTRGRYARMARRAGVA